MRTETADIREVFLNGTADALAAMLASEHPADLARALQTLDPATAWNCLRQGRRDRQADVFGYLDSDFQTALATVTPRADLAAIVTEMNADDRADLYKGLSDEQRKALMPGLAQAEREDVRRLASYEEGTAGAIMTSGYATLSPRISATKALTTLRRK